MSFEPLQTYQVSPFVRWTVPSSESTKFDFPEPESPGDYSNDLIDESEERERELNHILERNVNSWFVTKEAFPAVAIKNRYYIFVDERKQAVSKPLTSFVLYALSTVGEKSLAQARNLAKAGFKWDPKESAVSLGLILQAVSLLTWLQNTSGREPDLYETEDSGLVIDYVSDNDRVACVLREGYAHIMSMIRGNSTDLVLQDQDFSLEQVRDKVEQLINVWKTKKA